MTKPIIRIHDTSTGEIIDREMTNDEFAAYEVNVVKTEELKVKDALKEQAKSKLLERLGITEDEAKLLLG